MAFARSPSHPAGERRTGRVAGATSVPRRSMVMRHLIRRISIYLLAIWVAITLNFFLPRLAPGNPAEVIFSRLQGQGANPALLNALEVEFGVNTTDSLWVQYLKYLNNLIHGNLGISFQYYPSQV